MKILFVNEYFYPFTPGGAEWSIYYLAKALVEKGHEVGILTPNYGAKSFETIEGIKVYRFPFPAKLSPGQHSVRYFYHANPLFYLYNAFWIIKITRKENYQLIHSQNRFSLPGSFLAGKILRKPVFFYIRDVSSFCPIGMCTHQFYKNGIKDCDFKNYCQSCTEEYLRCYLNNPKGLKKIFHKLILFYLFLDNRWQRFCLNHINGVTALSKGVLEVYRKSQVLNKAIPSRVVPSLLPKIPKVSLRKKQFLRRQLGVGQGKHLILSVGKFSHGKGTPVFVKAIREILKKRKDVIFLLVGKGKKPTLKHSNVKILSSLPHEQILQLYPLASIVVIPSVNPEGLNRVIIEAMASGVPVISTSTGGTPELIEDGKSGILLEPFDWQSLYKKILFLLENQKLRKRIAKEGKRNLEEKLEQKKVVEKLLDFYTAFAKTPPT